MNQSSHTRLLISLQRWSLIAFALGIAAGWLIMLPYFKSGPVMQRDGAYVDKTGVERTAAEFETYSFRETTARCAGALGLVSAGVSMLAGFGLRSR